MNYVLLGLGFLLAMVVMFVVFEILARKTHIFDDDSPERKSDITDDYRL